MEKIDHQPRGFIGLKAYGQEVLAYGRIPRIPKVMSQSKDQDRRRTEKNRIKKGTFQAVGVGILPEIGLSAKPFPATFEICLEGQLAIFDLLSNLTPGNPGS